MKDNRYIYAEGDRFKVMAHTSPFSLEIVRKGDGCNCYFQAGDDSLLFAEELNNAERAKEDIARLGSNPVDYVCASYESVLRWET